MVQEASLHSSLHFLCKAEEKEVSQAPKHPVKSTEIFAPLDHPRILLIFSYLSGYSSNQPTSSNRPLTEIQDTSCLFNSIQQLGEGQVRDLGGLWGQNGQCQGEDFRKEGYQVLPKLYKIRTLNTQTPDISCAGQQGPETGRAQGNYPLPSLSWGRITPLSLPRPVEETDWLFCRSLFDTHVHTLY